ncbi:MAG: peptide deformylase [Coriobacteriia bacterium]|nr:peptide deformylase [Coriobacteriia bacterium]
MIRPIMKSEVILAQPCAAATAADLDVAQDLLDTLAAHRDTCVGMAANMIGVRKQVIVFVDGNTPRAMLNPEIVSAQGPYQVKEGCLSLVGTREATRYKRIKVRYVGLDMKERTEGFSGWTAQIIQHEVDHCNGIVI